MAVNLSTARLRQLILAFYSEHDPVKLQQGMDVNGIIVWTQDHGLDRLNELLMRQFGAMIDPSAVPELENAHKRFQRMSAALTPGLFNQSKALSMDINAKERDIRNKLRIFYSKHDPSRLDPSLKDQFDRIVNFSLYHGIPKLNEKLMKKYGDCLADNMNTPLNNDAISLLEDGDTVIDEPVNQLKQLSAVIVDKVDEKELKSDLQLYFTTMGLDDQLEVIDEIAEWVLKMGFTETNQKFDQMFGRTFDEQLIKLGRKPYGSDSNEVDFEDAETAIDGPILQQSYEEEEEDFDNDNYNDILTVDPRRPIVKGRPFEQMSDEDLMKELRAYYAKHDPDNMVKLREVLDLARRLGRDGLNSKLEGIYGEKLRPNMDYDEFDFGYDPNMDDLVRAFNRDETMSFNAAMNVSSSATVIAAPVPPPRRMVGNQGHTSATGSLFSVAIKAPVPPPVGMRSQMRPLNIDQGQSQRIISPGTSMRDIMPHDPPMPENNISTLSRNNINGNELWDSSTNANGKTMPGKMTKEEKKALKQAKLDQQKAAKALRAAEAKAAKEAKAAERLAIKEAKAQERQHKELMKTMTKSIKSRNGTQFNRGNTGREDSGLPNNEMSAGSMVQRSIPIPHPKGSNISMTKRIPGGATALPGLANGMGMVMMNTQPRNRGYSEYNDTIPPPIPAGVRGTSFSSQTPNANNLNGRTASFASFSGAGPQVLPQLPKNIALKHVDTTLSSASKTNAMMPRAQGGSNYVRAERMGEVNTGNTEFFRRAQQIRKRNQEGKSLVTGSDGRKEELNILDSAQCPRYELDILTGVCTRCGFPKAAHSIKARRQHAKGNNGFGNTPMMSPEQLEEEVSSWTNTNSPSVMKMAQQVNDTMSKRQIEQQQQQSRDRFGSMFKQQFARKVGAKQIRPPTTQFMNGLRLQPRGEDEFALLTSASMRVSWRGQAINNSQE